MDIFGFQIAGMLNENEDLNEIDVIAMLLKCDMPLQSLLIDMARNGSGVIKQIGVNKKEEVLESISKAPFVLYNDFEMMAKPLFSKLESNGERIVVTASDSLFFTEIAKLSKKYKLDQTVSFRNRSSCRFYAYWITTGMIEELELRYRELREVFELDKKNYTAFVHYERVLKTVAKELLRNGIRMLVEKYPSGQKRSEGVRIIVKR